MTHTTHLAVDNPATDIRCAIYRRYSSDMQRPASLEDQERNCRDAAHKRGWIVLDDYVRSDRAISGTTMHGRDGLNSLLVDVKKKPRPFDYILIDDTSRLGRNLGEVRQIIDRLNYAGVDVYFVSYNLDSRDPSFSLTHSVYGILDGQFCRGLAEKVHRGQKGRVLNGLSSGSRCFGYKSVPVHSRSTEHGRAATIGT